MITQEKKATANERGSRKMCKSSSLQRGVSDAGTGAGTESASWQCLNVGGGASNFQKICASDEDVLE
jgi:hypothetical protein